MSCLIGFWLPDDLRREMENFCRAHAYDFADPYITLITPRNLDSTAIVQQKLESFCLAQSDFRVVVSEPGYFYNHSLYLTVQEGIINVVRELLAAHLKLPVGRTYHPRLTLMRQAAGCRIDWDRCFEDARAAFSKEYPFQVTELVLFTQKAKNDPFEPTATIPFTGR